MDIIPFVSVGNLLFSDNRENLRKKLNESFRTVVREFAGDKEYFDHFFKSDLLVFYDEYDNIDAFDFGSGEIKFNGVDLFKITYRELVNLFENLDRDLKIGYGEFTSNKYGIGGSTNENPEDENAFPTGIIIFRSGSYNSLKS